MFQSVLIHVAVNDQTARKMYHMMLVMAILLVFWSTLQTSRPFCHFYMRHLSRLRNIYKFNTTKCHAMFCL